jgi:hypothetical protein
MEILDQPEPYVKCFVDNTSDNASSREAKCSISYIEDAQISAEDKCRYALS